jgi:hypothetical protein
MHFSSAANFVFSSVDLGEGFRQASSVSNFQSHLPRSQGEGSVCSWINSHTHHADFLVEHFRFWPSPRLVCREVGQRNRSVASTLMNNESSRSHSIFTITVETAETGIDNKERSSKGCVCIGWLRRPLDGTVQVSYGLLQPFARSLGWNAAAHLCHIVPETLAEIITRSTSAQIVPTIAPAAKCCGL